MRTIRFRGKKQSNGIWAYGSLVYSDVLSTAIYFQSGRGSIKSMEWVYVDPNSVGQLTMFRDRNGKQIYEGDILRSDDYPFSDGKEKDNYLGVVFCTEDGSFEIMQFVTKQSKCRGISNFINRPFYDINMEKVEVIGNILTTKDYSATATKKLWNGITVKTKSKWVNRKEVRTRIRRFRPCSRETIKMSSCRMTG